MKNDERSLREMKGQGQRKTPNRKKREISRAKDKGPINQQSAIPLRFAPGTIVHNQQFPSTRNPLPLSVAILAGGKSSRLGQDKAFVEVRGRPLIEDLVAQTEGVGTETLIVTNHPKAYRYLNLPLFSDVLPERGPLGGLYTALLA